MAEPAAGGGQAATIEHGKKETKLIEAVHRGIPSRGMINAV
jgi:hypothetical protein